jgi:tetratricopeptide (TPR) repeat protein
MDFSQLFHRKGAKTRRSLNQAGTRRICAPYSVYLLLILCAGFTRAAVAQTAHELLVSAMAKDSAKDFNGALEDLEKALKMQENDSLHLLHARVETETNHYKEAYEEVNDVIRHNNSCADAYMLRGILRARQGNFEGAVKDFNKCIKFNPKNAKAFYNRGLAHAYLEEIRQAIQDFTAATELEANYAIAWFQRGYWKEISGDLEGSLADLIKAKELNPNDKNLYVSLAVTNYKLKRTQEACEHLNEAKNRGSTEAEELIMIFCSDK